MYSPHGIPVTTESGPKLMVEDAVASEINSCATERRPNPNANGYIRSNPFALSTLDTSFALPDVVPVGDIAWPPPLLTLWRTMKCTSIVGVFPDLFRVWFTVDNKLVLWDFRAKSEFSLYDELPELIVAVGKPVRPRPGVFQPHVTYILPVATSNFVVLLGLCVVNEDKLSEIKMVNLGYSARAETTILKIDGIADIGRIFCAGTNGNVYEVQYLRESTPLLPKIRLVCFSYILSSKPILGQITGAINMARQTWGRPNAELRDITIDAREELLFSLDTEGTITVWRIHENGLRKVTSLRHAPQAAASRSNDGSFAPLIRLFIVSPDADGSTLLAVAANGQRFRYRYRRSLGNDNNLELLLRSHDEPVFGHDDSVGVCFAADTVVIMSHCPRDAEDTTPDQVAVATAPRTLMEPHQNFREVVANFDPRSSTHMLRVDAIDRLPNGKRKSLNELCAQVTYPAARFIVVHRHGLSVYMQLRPVDTLYTIMSASDARSREGLLQRFAAVHNQTDYVTMLIQIASGALHTVERNALVLSDVAPSLQSSTTGNKGGPSLDVLGRLILSADSLEAKRLAKDLLQSVLLPTVQPLSTGSGFQVAAVDLSPFCVGVVTFIARAVYSVWDVRVTRLALGDLSAVQDILVKLTRLLESLEIGTHSRQSLRVDVLHQWQRYKAIVTLQPGASLSHQDVNRLQLTVLDEAYQLARKALQTAILLDKARHLPWASEDRSITFGQIVRDQEIAHRIGARVARQVMASQQGVEGTPGERLRNLHAVQTRCPYFFSASDAQEFLDRAEIENITGGESITALSESRLAQWAATVTPKAASYWTSGALERICQQLEDVKREELAVQLLLHAAFQLDPNGETFPLYIADRDLQAPLQTTNTRLSSMYLSKRRALDYVVSILTSAWDSHRSAVDSLLGGPRASGSIWQVEPNDEVAHCFLFDFLAAPRDDEMLSRSLRETLIAVRSNFLEKYLIRNAAMLSEEYALYLRRTKGDAKAAIEQNVLLAQSDLSHIPSAERLRVRIRCLSEALDCARDCDSDQAHYVEGRLALLNAQERLCSVVAEYLGSANPALDRLVMVEGRRVTEREIANQHLELLQNTVLTTAQLLSLAGMYSTYGGAEVQLDALSCANVQDPSAYASVIARAYDLYHGSIEDITRRLVERYYRQRAAFPVSFVVRVLEAHYYPLSPAGSNSAVHLLLDCGVDVMVLFHAYKMVIEQNDDVTFTCEAFERANVTGAYLTCSLAAIVAVMAKTARNGTVQFTAVNTALSIVQGYILEISRSLGNTATPDEGACLRSADAEIRNADYILRNGGF